MTKQLLIHRGIAELQIALVHDGVLERYWSEMVLGGEDGRERTGASRVGDIVLARVKRVLSALNAAFVDIGDRRDGFLAARDAQKRGSVKHGEAPKIAELVREGEGVLVQVLRDAMGDKGARLGLNLTIAGRYLVLAPDGGRVRLSRRIEDEGERARLKSILEAMEQANGDFSFVVRTAAIGAGEEELREDVEYLTDVWEEIVAATSSHKPVETLHHELGAIERTLRDEVGPELEQVIVDERQALESARAYAEDAMPGYAESIVLHEGASPLFAEYGIEDDIAALRFSELALPNGGWITIEPTEALTAIDVNSGKHMARSDLEATALDVNLEAAQMIARQIILRSLGGLIVVDFIPLADDDSLDRVASLLVEQLKRGGAAADVKHKAGMNIVAISVKRLRKSVDRRATEACAICDGHGRRRSVSAIALDALRQVESAALGSPGTPIAMRVSTEIADWLEERSDALRTAFSRKGVNALRVFPEPDRARDSFSVETLGTEAAP
jgi:ribonuclease G